MPASALVAMQTLDVGTLVRYDEAGRQLWEASERNGDALAEKLRQGRTEYSALAAPAPLKAGVADGEVTIHAWGWMAGVESSPHSGAIQRTRVLRLLVRLQIQLARQAAKHREPSGKSLKQDASQGNQKAREPGFVVWTGAAPHPY